MDGHSEAKQRAVSPQLSFLRTIAIKLQEHHKLDQTLSATELTDLCMENAIEIPGLAPDNQTVEEGRKQIGRVLGKLFSKTAEITFDGFKVVKEGVNLKTMTGNDQKLNRYTFSTVSPDLPKQAIPEPLSDGKCP